MTSTTTSTSPLTHACMICSGSGISGFGDECVKCDGTGRTRTAVSAPEPRSDAPTEGQLRFAASLVDQLREAGDPERADLLAAKVAKATKRSISPLLDDAKLDVQNARQLRKAQGRKADQAQEDGFYTLGGLVAKLQLARSSRNLYGKLLDPETGSFDYTPGLPARIRREGWAKLTLEEAKGLGHLYGRCVCCGATLTDENSIAAGIGPICASKF